MKRLILVRHGKANPEHKEDNDIDRDLIKKGQKDSKLIAEVLKKNKVKPDLIISSVANRALQTAEIFAEIMEIDKNEIKQEQFLYDGYTTGQLSDFIGEQSDDLQTIMIVGHNPFISQSGIRLSKNFHQSFPTVGCLGLKFNVENWHFEPGSGDIDFFEFPKKYF